MFEISGDKGVGLLGKKSLNFWIDSRFSWSSVNKRMVTHKSNHTQTPALTTPSRENFFEDLSQKNNFSAQSTSTMITMATNLYIKRFESRGI
ncbi:MAG TPA: hypothetical protein VLE72_02695 [Candidatus Saccharimonadales bacterium]|nr:hypothetical protein [Candidatus Saccharimonadales bacterium]